PLRDTVSAAGPFDLNIMFEVGNSMIERMTSAAAHFFPAPKSPATKAPDLISLNVQGTIAQPASIIAVPAVLSQGWKARKTVKACQVQWRALRMANQRTTTEKEYVVDCRAGAVGARPALARTNADAAPSQAITQKTVKLCQEEWRALRISNQRTPIEK